MTVTRGSHMFCDDRSLSALGLITYRGPPPWGLLAGVFLSWRLVSPKNLKEKSHPSSITGRADEVRMLRRHTKKMQHTLIERMTSLRQKCNAHVCTQSDIQQRRCQGDSVDPSANSSQITTSNPAYRGLPSERRKLDKPTSSAPGI